MLGLGNKLNRSRVYKTFVGAGVVYENVLANGSFGQGGYVISSVVDETTSPATITYTEVYPQAITFSNGESKAIASDGASFIHNSLQYTSQEGEESAVVYGDYRMASPSEFNAWVNVVYPENQSQYYSSESSENLYILVTPGFYGPWRGLGFYAFDSSTASQALGNFYLDDTDGSSAFNPSEEQLINGTFYFLAVREFTENLIIANQTPLPASTPAPTEPSPLPYQLRNSNDLTNTVTSNTGDDGFDLSVNAQLLETNELNMFLVGKTPRLGNLIPSADDRYKVQVKLTFPVDQTTNIAYSLPEPWSPSNTEQKKALVKYVVLGWKDFPFINTPLDSSDPSVIGPILDGSITPVELIEYTNKVITKEITLSKVTIEDISSNSNAIPLPDGSGGTVDGYYTNVDNNNEVEFSYVGYLDLADTPVSHITGIQGDSAYSLIEATDNVSSTPLYIANDDRRYFLVRVISVSFGTNQRPFSETLLFPDDLKYIFVPITTPATFGVFHNLIGGLPDPTGDSAGFINYMYSTSSGQNIPPSVGGDNEDYYN